MLPSVRWFRSYRPCFPSVHTFTSLRQFVRIWRNFVVYHVPDRVLSLRGFHRRPQWRPFALDLAIRGHSLRSYEHMKGLSWIDLKLLPLQRWGSLHICTSWCHLLFPEEDGQQQTKFYAWLRIRIRYAIAFRETYRLSEALLCLVCHQSKATLVRHGRHVRYGCIKVSTLLRHFAFFERTERTAA